MSLVTSSPKTRASPDVGESRVVRILIVVVFPAPFGPINPKSSPFRTSNEIPESASVTRLVLPKKERETYSRLRSFTSIVASGVLFESSSRSRCETWDIQREKGSASQRALTLLVEKVYKIYRV